MKVEFPIMFKYFRIEQGTVPRQKTDEVEYEGYITYDQNGVIAASGSGLAQLVDYTAKLDIQAECAAQFLARHLPGFEHLEDVDIDAPAERPSGLLMPDPSGGGGTLLN